MSTMVQRIMAVASTMVSPKRIVSCAGNSNSQDTAISSKSEPKSSQPENGRSIRSVSGTTLPGRIYARKPKVREIQNHHLRWLWAAYKLGAFAEVVPEGLDDNGFEEAIVDLLASVDFGWVIEAQGEEGLRPVGVVLGQSRAAGRGVEPHVDWFPWATTRNRLEGIAVFLRDVSKQLKIFVFAEEGDTRFWSWYNKRRMLVGGGRVIDYFSRGEHAYLYYTAGP